MTLQAAGDLAELETVSQPTFTLTRRTLTRLERNKEEHYLADCINIFTREILL